LYNYVLLYFLKQPEELDMIEVTNEARKELKKILTENAQDPNLVLRLIANEQGQLGLVMDNAAEDDKIIEYEGMKVLVIEDHFASHLEGVKLEVEETPEGPSLTLTGAGCGSCSCGEEHEEKGCGGSCCGSDSPA
jgi:Fe-S cluster assembly iron-binding protein IscA